MVGDKLDDLGTMQSARPVAIFYSFTILNETGVSVTDIIVMR